MKKTSVFNVLAMLTNYNFEVERMMSTKSFLCSEMFKKINFQNYLTPKHYFYFLLLNHIAGTNLLTSAAVHIGIQSLTI